MKETSWSDAAGGATLIGVTQAAVPVVSLLAAIPVAIVLFCTVVAALFGVGIAALWLIINFFEFMQS
ncbi:MAG: hypothetical protein RDU25_02960 [Patescibacteria group bacterium]|nr:hypothetical protein [Patescibacteria group bacterium]